MIKKTLSVSLLSFLAIALNGKSLALNLEESDQCPVADTGIEQANGPEERLGDEDYVARLNLGADEIEQVNEPVNQANEPVNRTARLSNCRRGAQRRTLDRRTLEGMILWLNLVGIQIRSLNLTVSNEELRVMNRFSNLIARFNSDISNRGANFENEALEIVNDFVNLSTRVNDLVNLSTRLDPDEEAKEQVSEQSENLDEEEIEQVSEQSENLDEEAKEQVSEQSEQLNPIDDLEMIDFLNMATGLIERYNIKLSNEESEVINRFSSVIPRLDDEGIPIITRVDSRGNTVPIDFANEEEQKIVHDFVMLFPKLVRAEEEAALREKKEADLREKKEAALKEEADLIKHMMMKSKENHRALIRKKDMDQKFKERREEMLKRCEEVSSSSEEIQNNSNSNSEEIHENSNSNSE